MRPIERLISQILRSRWIGSLSNGVRIRRRTAAFIRKGNIARDRQDWVQAANAYLAALAIEPQLQHVWVQLGHMQKEAGSITEAAQAYHQAADLAPADAEPLRQLGYMAKAWQDPAIAAQYFTEALKYDPTSLDLLSELARLLPEYGRLSPEHRRKLAATLGSEPQARALAHKGGEARTMVCDVTDLLAFFGRRRLPTGIQRLQIEIALACLSPSFHPNVIFSQYSSGRRAWIRIPSEVFHHICLLAKQSDDVDDPVWHGSLKELYSNLAFEDSINLESVSVIVNIGTSWSDKNYLLDVRNARDNYHTRYVCTLFDVIPLINPDWFTQSLVEEYRYSFDSLAHSADGILAISEATRADFLAKTEEQGTPFAPDAVAVVRLDGDFRQAAAPAESLRRWGLEGQDFVLFVSTLEPRKNHVGAFEAWLILARELGEQHVPKLVCVGGRGWLNAHLHEMLRTNQVLQRRVVILHGVPDDMLATLYQHCLFALYPSFYEGWGLPVSEALSYGKVPAISKTSSLPEAGGTYARYFDPKDPADIAAVVRTLLDDDSRRAAESAIRQSYLARPWDVIAGELINRAGAFPVRVDEGLPFIDGEGRWTFSRLAKGPGRHQEGTPRNGEALRQGQSWLFPDQEGCRIEGDDAALRFHWSGGSGASAHIVVSSIGETSSVDIEMLNETKRHRVTIESDSRVRLPLPSTEATLRIRIIPVAGQLLVREMEIRRSGD